MDRSSEAGSQGDTTVTDMATSEMNVVTKRSGFVSEDELLPTSHFQSGGGGSSNSNSIHGRGDISSSVARVDCVFPSPQCDPLLPWRKAFHLMKASPNLSLLMGSNPLSRSFVMVVSIYYSAPDARRLSCTSLPDSTDTLVEGRTSSRGPGNGCTLYQQLQHGSGLDTTSTSSSL